MQITIAPTIFSSVFITGSLKLHVSGRSLLANYTTKLGILNDQGLRSLSTPEKSAFRKLANLSRSCRKSRSIKEDVKKNTSPATGRDLVIQPRVVMRRCDFAFP